MDHLDDLLRTKNVFLFVPNLIGYGRIFFSVLACFTMRYCHSFTLWCYFISAILDAADGHAARKLNQSTKFGAMLDQLVDRCSTMTLMICLGGFYPALMPFFQIACVIDISCHWIHLHATILKGRTSHKDSDSNENPLLKVYYTSKPVLFTMCATNEMFYMLCYMYHFTAGPSLPLVGIGLVPIFIVLLFPFALAKLFLAVMQGYTAAKTLASLDTDDRLALGKKTEDVSLDSRRVRRGQ